MSDEDAGRVLAGRYRLIEELGAGGMGTVWRAMDELAQREVALKRLRPEYVKESRLRRRLRREARAVARLEHPNIVRLYDMGEDSDQSPFLAMEMVRGQPLSHMIDQNLPLETVRDYVDQILGALAFAHARGVIHRDLKPDNVVVATGERGQQIVKLLDFGFARVEDDSDDQLSMQAKDVFGTPTYMAPEQATSDYEVSPATDLYALGVIFWELLTGRPPFTGKSGTAIVVQHVTKALPPFRSRYETVPDLLELLQRALEKEPSRRFGSAGEMRRALSAVFDEEEEAATIVADPSFFAAADGEATIIVEDDESLISLTGTDLTSLGGPAPPESLPIVGRDGLLRWLWERVVTVCREGQPACVMLDGPVGMGKSRMCAWLYRALVEGGWMTPAVGFYRTGSGVAGGFRSALRGILGITGRQKKGTEALRQTLEQLDPGRELDPQLLEAWLFPELGRPAPLGRVLRLVPRLLTLFAERRPVFVWLDEFPRAPADELAIFEHLMARLQSRPVPILIVATRRSEVTQPVTGRFNTVLRRRLEQIEVRSVPRLADEDVMTLVQQALPVEGEVAGRVARAARGNPLYAHQAIKYLYEVGALRSRSGTWYWRREPVPLPPSLLELTRARIGNALGEENEDLRALVEQLALLGDAFPYGLAEAMARRFSLDVVRLETGLDALARLGILADVEGDAFAFVHELMREALLQELAGRPEAPGVQVAVGQAKVDYYGDDLARAAAEIAVHFRASGNTAEGVGYLLLAAQAARDTFQTGAAEALYAQADRWLSNAKVNHPALRADVYLGLAELALQAHDSQRALRLAERLSSWAQGAADVGRAAAALRIRGEALVDAGQWREAMPALDEAAHGYAAIGDELGAARVSLARGRAALQSGAGREAEERFSSAGETFTRAGDLRGAAACRRALGELALRAGDRAKATSLLIEAASMAEAANDQDLLAKATWRLGELARQASQLELAERYYAQAVDAYEAIGNPAGAGRSLRGLGDVQRILQRPAARITYRRAVEIFEGERDLFQLAICYTQLGRLALDAGDAVPAEAAFERALASLEHFDDPVRVGVIHGFLARTAQRRGDAEVRDMRLKMALQIDAHRPLVVSEWPRVLEEVAEGVAAEGNHKRARVLLERAHEVWLALRQAERAAQVQERLARLS